MAQSMLLFVGLAAAPEATDDQTRSYNDSWGEWMGGLARDRALPAGAPFVPGGKRVEGDAATDLVLDRVDVGGFALIDATSLDDAVAIAKRAPHMALGGATLVRPCVALGAP
jgi:hypothetical protein